MRGLVDALLLLARGDARQLQLTGTLVDLRDVAGEACAQLQSRADAAGVRLELINPAVSARVAGDADLLGQIVGNLISNGIQHTPGGGTVRVQVSNPEQPELQVVDSGCGIAAEYLPRIFDRFYRVDESRGRRSGGNGLGLAICRSLAELHGAVIECRSEPDKGSVFTVQFPQPPRGLASDQTVNQGNG
jgi:signal transduction histidine kinase